MTKVNSTHFVKVLWKEARMKKHQHISTNISIGTDVCQPIQAPSSTSSQVCATPPAEKHTQSHCHRIYSAGTSSMTDSQIHPSEHDVEYERTNRFDSIGSIQRTHPHHQAHTALATDN